MAVTSIKTSWSHLYTSSDDGTINVYCLVTLTLQRTIRFGIKDIPGATFVQCLYIDETSTDCRYLYAGCASGKVHKFRLGQWM
mmetsp:Transcript_38249/g.57257  ORF Transcript_38249/g.57257 Transcript_38249/m.57257 type:complete len:83 (+) Transcript_38249:142-390(+)